MGSAMYPEQTRDMPVKLHISEQGDPINVLWSRIRKITTVVTPMDKCKFPDCGEHFSVSLCCLFPLLNAVFLSSLAQGVRELCWTMLMAAREQFSVLPHTGQLPPYSFESTNTLNSRQSWSNMCISIFFNGSGRPVSRHPYLIPYTDEHLDVWVLHPLYCTS